MQIVAGVTTAGRDGVSYLESTSASLAAAGFDSPVVFDDPDKLLGPYRNFKRALSELACHFPEAEALAVFQDDIAVARGLRGWLEESLWPSNSQSIGVCSLYCAASRIPPIAGWSKLPLKPEEGDGGREERCAAVLAELNARGRQVPRTGEDRIDAVQFVREYPDQQLFAAHMAHAPGLMERWRWYRRIEWEDQGEPQWSLSETHPWDTAYGACAYIVPRQAVEYLVDRCRHPESTNKTDLHVAETCWREGLSYWQFSPALVEHVGMKSSLHDHGLSVHRQAGEWCRDVRELRTTEGVTA
jgi:hypothetical protein